MAKNYQPIISSVNSTLSDFSPNKSSKSSQPSHTRVFTSLQDYFNSIQDPDDTTHHIEPNLDDNLSLHDFCHQTTSQKKIVRSLAVAGLTVSCFGIPYLMSGSKLIEPGQMGCCVDYHGKLEIYGPGRHLILSPFSHLVLIDMDSPHSRFLPERSGGALFQLINVPTGSIGVALDNNKPVILNPGKHVIESSGFIYKGCHKMTADRIDIGDVIIVNVDRNEIGWGQDKGKIHILKPGRHVIQSPTFNYGGVVKQNQTLIDFGAIIFLTVPQNEAYIIHRSDGSRSLVTQGFYVLENAAQFKVAKTPVILNWQEVTFKSQVRTKDGVGLNIQAAIFLRIADPQQAFAAIATPIDYVITRAQAILGNIISESPLTQSNARTSDLPQTGAPPNYTFDGGSVHSKFENDMRQELSDHGIELKSMRVINWEFSDAQTASRIAQAAAASADIQVKSDNALRQKAIALVQKDGEAEAIRRMAQAESDAVKIRRQGEAEAISLLYENIKARTGSEYLAKQAVETGLLQTVLKDNKIIFTSGIDNLSMASLTKAISSTTS